MRQTFSTPRPMIGHSLCAVVLLALLALLHATLSPGASHLAALDLDGCPQQQRPAASAQTCVTAPVAALTEAGAVGHHDGDTTPLCAASASGPRQAAHLPSPFATAHAVSGGAAALPARTSRADATRLTSPRAPSGSLVLRC
ncbi:hypothetical protein [Streptomyces sp. P17]|uniref:hypothetical protein n=1 Tax=Streptomyces sp. P17 TaxID=3074716 RepID=UPI0028F400B0|nr:hypothetical protein [Streptomyces sp. P17]MDT9695149.1 hypothetical protein [Streptomyces sp. P17]